MFRRLGAWMVVCLLISAMLPMAVFAKADPVEWLDASRASQGVVGIRYEMKKNTLTKVLVKKGTDTYTYTLRESAPQTEWLPLQMGDGNYEIIVAEHAGGNKFKVTVTRKIAVKIAKPTDVYLNATQFVNWEHADKTVAKAKELTRDRKSEDAKLAAIYNYIVNNVKYDYQLAKTVKADYMPTIDNTLKTNKGICYDYAVLMAAMLRSAGIPAKLVMGTTTAVAEYHAWNEVYLNGKWIIVDTTIDANLVQAGQKVAMAKKADNYTAEKVY